MTHRSFCFFWHPPQHIDLSQSSLSLSTDNQRGTCRKYALPRNQWHCHNQNHQRKQWGQRSPARWVEGGSEERTEGCSPSSPAECPTGQVAKTTGVAAVGPLYGGGENASTLVLIFKKLEGEGDNLKRKEVQTKQGGMEHAKTQSTSVTNQKNNSQEGKTSLSSSPSLNESQKKKGFPQRGETCKVSRQTFARNLSSQKRTFLRPLFELTTINRGP